MKTFELFNTQTEQVEALQTMTALEAEDRNSRLQANGEPQRWVRHISSIHADAQN